MMSSSLLNWKLKATIFSMVLFGSIFAQTATVPLYRVFELSVTNEKAYDNKFIGVDFTATYTSPSGKSFEFPGFFDGDGAGGGDYQNGNVWKLRFMPNELGEWTYEYSWSDSTTGGSGAFTCVAEGAGKGVLQAYKDNPRWFAYNGTEPVFLKSYYESSMRPFQQPWSYMEKYYQAYLDNGYNHFQVNWLLPTVSGENVADCAAPTNNDAIYAEKGKASSTMNLAVWNKMEVLLCWLNEKNVSLFPFLGFDGGRNNLPQAWASLCAKEQDFFVRYVVARIAPYAIITWNYVWEVPGNTENGELGCMRLVKKYDVFNHLRTYQDEFPKINYFNLPEYTFAGVENHGVLIGETKDPENWTTPWSHHEASLVGYVPGKPTYMVEGNALWRRFWAPWLASKYHQTVTQADVRGAAWACTMAAGSFTWCGHTTLSLTSTAGLPFFENISNSYRPAAKAIDLLTDIMNNEVVFYRMTPQDNLLSGHDNHSVWCLAEPGSQYLVFAASGKNFTLNLAEGQYANNLWIDTITGNEQAASSVTGGAAINFSPPNTSTDWALILKTNDVMGVEDKRNYDADQLTKDFVLDQNYPNPFNPQTTIRYNLFESGFVTLTIHNATGQVIAVLENGYRPAGPHTVIWNTEGMANGVYFYKLKVGNAVKFRKLEVLK